MFLNDTEIEVVEISEIEDEFEIEGTYSITEFDFSNGNIDKENDVTKWDVSSTGFSSTAIDLTLSNGTDGLTWNASIANIYLSKEDIFVFEDDELYTFR